jgi:hypothetical protein
MEIEEAEYDHGSSSPSDKLGISWISFIACELTPWSILTTKISPIDRSSWGSNYKLIGSRIITSMCPSGSFISKTYYNLMKARLPITGINNQGYY